MTLSLAETQAINDLAGSLYEFLPGSGNANCSFPIAASQAGAVGFWQGGSKRPALLRLLEATFTQSRHRFCPLILAIVRLSLPWRAGRNDPLRVDEIDALHAIMLRLSFKIPELHDAGFRKGLARAPAKPEIDRVHVDVLIAALLSLEMLAPISRGFAFERFLTDAFALYDLAPRGSFRLVGEQIDGSFQLYHDTYLLEAKWQGEPIGNRELQSFSGSVHSKSRWTRGLFVSYSGFSEEGLDAFARGAATGIICISGQELWQLLKAGLHLPEVLSRKQRRADETGRAFVPLSILSPGV